jgi:glutamate N-acetyltransferase/amino-acid N-acetyltransferase
MPSLSYPELDIRIETGPGKDSTDDAVFFTVSGRSGAKEFQIENSLSHQPSGIRALETTLGIKKSGKPDFTVALLDRPAPAAAVFTKSLCPSETIVRNREILKTGMLQALAVNSGNANVYTPDGRKHVEHTAELLGREFGIRPEHILICSTGVIGVPLPMEKFEAGIPGLKAKLQPGNLDCTAKAILTTDLGPKTASIRIGDVLLCGMAKGAGMIEPNMATMLVYFFTNADLPAAELQKSLEAAVACSFNRISIDTDTSTSDAVALFSCPQVSLDADARQCFDAALRAMSVKLARDIVSQGEGVTKIIECVVDSGYSAEFALQTAKRIINSPLVKAAVHGADPNWGRIVAAIGKGVAPDGLSESSSIGVLGPRSVRVELMGTPVYDGGRPLTTDLAGVSRRMAEASLVSIAVEIYGNTHRARVWGCDLTEEYVTFNSDYTS